jgi:hypothetical protein
MAGKAKLKAAHPGGRPRLDSPKIHLSVRLDAAVVAAVKGSGRGYNKRVEQVLREAIAAGAFARSGSANARTASMSICSNKNLRGQGFGCDENGSGHLSPPEMQSVRPCFAIRPKCAILPRNGDQADDAEVDGCPNSIPRSHAPSRCIP